MLSSGGALALLLGPLLLGPLGLAAPAAAAGCEFRPGVDYADPAGPVLNATSAAECCSLCLALPECVTAVFAGGATKAGAGTGRCYTKTGGKSPVDKGPAAGIVGCVTARAAVTDRFYDCRFRRLALEFANDVVLSSWASPTRVAEAKRAIANGLRIDQCPAERNTLETPPPPPPPPPQQQRTPHQLEIFIAPNGDDSAAGTAAAPLRSIAGAQAHIRAAHPTVSARPPIRVTLRSGDYYVPPRHGPPGAQSPRAATFGAADSGSAAHAPITYAADLDAADQPVDVTLHGGVLLSAHKLPWSASSKVSGAWETTLPAGIEVDSQDQLYLGGEPLVRARLPNGRPWLPLDGFNLTAGNATQATIQPLPNIPRVADTCGTPDPHPKMPTPAHGHGVPPAPPQPALGKCSALVVGVTLLSGSGLGPPDFLMIGKTPNATACRAICEAQQCCAGFTWHDQHQAQWAHDCYLVTNPLAVWTRAQNSGVGHTSGLCNHGGAKPCSGADVGPPCEAADVVCAATKETMVRGPVPEHGLGESVTVDDCYEHLPDAGNSWPLWQAAAYGLLDQSAANASSAVNMLDLSQNLPHSFGPWASGLLVTGSQDAGRGPSLKSLEWPDADQVVVHSMADGEWGGVQFRASNATKLPNGDTVLGFSEGGWQQARGASLHAYDGHLGNRYYMEGSIEFLDDESEWHFDPETRRLTIVAPPDATAASIAAMPLVLTQTDTVLSFAGAEDGRVQHLVVANLTVAHTSAQHFLPHEETSGGDYAITRGGAISVENASSLLFQGNDLRHIGGNGVCLSNSVSNVSVRQNRFSFLGTSGVVIVGRTGNAMMDARDGEAMAAAGGSDNGVRLPRDNVVTQNVFSDYGIWDKQSAAFYKALAPGNAFTENVVFNCSRHGVNFQDSMGGEGLVANNVFFNLNRYCIHNDAFPA